SFLSPALLADYESLLHALGDRGFTIALDTGWPPGGWNPELRQRVAGWLASCDHVLLNEIEGAGLSGEREVEAAAAWIATRPPRAAGAPRRGKMGPAGGPRWARSPGGACPRAESGRHRHHRRRRRLRRRLSHRLPQGPRPRRRARRRRRRRLGRDLDLAAAVWAGAKRAPRSFFPLAPRRGETVGMRRASQPLRPPPASAATRSRCA